jgi:hypothetical protein
VSDLLTALLSIGIVVAVGIVVPALIVRWRLRRRNRVHPKVASPAPLRWLVTPSTPARLHRRLQTTVRVASVHSGRELPLAVAEHAVELDRRVVLAARQPYASRSAALRALRAEADDLDRLALAIRRPLDLDAVGDPYERLATLAEAHAELDAIDHTVGGT